MSSSHEFYRLIHELMEEVQGFSNSKTSWQSGAMEHHKVTQCNKPHTRGFFVENRRVAASEQEERLQRAGRKRGFHRILEYVQPASGIVQGGRPGVSCDPWYWVTGARDLQVSKPGVKLGTGYFSLALYHARSRKREEWNSIKSDQE